MVEVFKTDVKDRGQAVMLVDQIHQFFREYKANFDLDDCDNILRVECASDFINNDFLINLFKDLGFCAEVLPDDDQPEFETEGKYAFTYFKNDTG